MSAELLSYSNIYDFRSEHHACSLAQLFPWSNCGCDSPVLHNQENIQSFGQQNIWLTPSGTANNILFKSWSEERLKHVCKYFFDKELYYEDSSHVNWSWSLSCVCKGLRLLDKTSYEAWNRMETVLLQRGYSSAPGSDTGWLSASPASSLSLGFLPCKRLCNLLIRSAAWELKNNIISRMQHTSALGRHNDCFWSHVLIKLNFMIYSSHEQMQLAASRDLSNAFSGGVNASHLRFLLVPSTFM